MKAWRIHLRFCYQSQLKHEPMNTEFQQARWSSITNKSFNVLSELRRFWRRLFLGLPWPKSLWLDRSTNRIWTLNESEPVVNKSNKTRWRSAIEATLLETPKAGATGYRAKRVEKLTVGPTKTGDQAKSEINEKWEAEELKRNLILRPMWPTIRYIIKAHAR